MNIELNSKSVLKWSLILFEILFGLSSIVLVFYEPAIAIYLLLAAIYVGRGNVE
jgi:hypothetical protein